MNDIDFAYKSVSHIYKKANLNELVLAHHTQIQEIQNIPCFFTGEIVDSALTAKCLMTVSKVVRSSFAPIPVRLLDPIVTTGKEKMRFEGFSSCNGVYARLDILEQGLDGQFIASGTTNVDFNEPMINALNAVKKQELMLLAVGDNEVRIQTEKTDVVEKKVKLPERWLKGLTSVQLYMADMKEVFKLNKMQTIQFFNQIPKGKSTAVLYASYIAGRLQLSPIAKPHSIRIGGIERLRLLEGLLPFIDVMCLYQADDGESLAVQLYMGHLRMTLAISPDYYRGFSGEGNVLDKLTDIPVEFIYAFNHLLKSNETFDPTLLSFEYDLDFATTEQMTASLSAMGLLGFDLEGYQHYYRRLPFKMDRILSLNPRLKNAKKLSNSQDVQLIKNTPTELEARVTGTDVTHTVLIKHGKPQCTCQWFAKHQTKRGLCKHILSVKMMTEQTVNNTIQ